MPSHEAAALLVSPKSQIAQLFRAGHRKVHFYEKKNVLDKHTFPSSTTSKELHFTVTLQRKKSIHTSKGGTRPEKIISTNHPNLSNVSALIRSVSSVPNTFRVNINKTHRIWKKKKWYQDKNDVVLPTTSPSNILKLKDSRPDPSLTHGFGLLNLLKANMGHRYKPSTNGLLLFVWQQPLSPASCSS